jgi:hypothetical protein
MGINMVDESKKPMVLNLARLPEFKIFNLTCEDFGTKMMPQFIKK